MTQTVQAPSRPGPAGHALPRLLAESSAYGALTVELLRRAGVEPGMRVLDVGCGPGDSSFAAAAVVGPEGEVLGVDRSHAAVARATAARRRAGLGHVRFAVADLEAVVLAGGFDAAIGRGVLVHLRRPAAALAQVAAAVEPGGIVAFQELVVSSATTSPRVPLYARVHRLLQATLSAAGLDPDLGRQLHGVFRDAGLPAPVAAPVRAGRPRRRPRRTRARPPACCAACCRWRSASTSPRRHEVQIDTLAARLHADALAADATVFLPSLWGRGRGCRGRRRRCHLAVTAPATWPALPTQRPHRDPPAHRCVRRCHQRLALADRRRQPQAVRDRGGLDREDLGAAAPDAGVRADLVPDPRVRQHGGVPAQLERPGPCRRCGSSPRRPARRSPRGSGCAAPAARQRSARSVPPSSSATSGHVVGVVRRRGRGRPARESSYARPPGSSIATSGSSSSSPTERCSTGVERRRAVERAHLRLDTTNAPSSTASRRSATRPWPVQRSSASRASAATTDHGSCDAAPWKPCRTPSTSHALPAFGSSTCQPPR